MAMMNTIERKKKKRHLTVFGSNVPYLIDALRYLYIYTFAYLQQKMPALYHLFSFA